MKIGLPPVEVLYHFTVSVEDARSVTDAGPQAVAAVTVGEDAELMMASTGTGVLGHTVPAVA